MAAENKIRTLGAVLYEGFELLDLYGPLEMFGCLGGDVRIETVAEQAGPVKSAQGPETVAAHSYDGAPPLDLLLLPGGIGTLPMLEDDAIQEFLRARSRQAELTLSVCSGSAILAKAGLLDGRRATSNKVFFNLATAQSDKVDWVVEARWVRDGPFVTSSGVSAGTDMALAVIAELYGRERAEAVAVVTEYSWHSDPASDPFARHLNDVSRIAAATGTAS